jgi:hypothetical protein
MPAARAKWRDARAACCGFRNARRARCRRETGQLGGDPALHPRRIFRPARARVDQGTLRCRLIHGRTGELVRDSVVRKARSLRRGEIREVESRDELRVLLSQATAVEESWLRDAFPDDFSEGTQTLFDPNLRRVVTRRTRLFRDLVLDFTEQDCTDAGSGGAACSRRKCSRAVAR